MGKVVLELVKDCWKPQKEQTDMAAFKRTNDPYWRPIPEGEADPNGLAAHEPGAKLDFGKAPVMRGVIKYFPRALLAVAALSKNGADKYAWDGWQSVPEGIQRYDDALARHILDEVIEGELDQKWKADGKDVLHATAIAWNALARLELVLREKESTALVRPLDAVAGGDSTITKGE